MNQSSTKEKESIKKCIICKQPKKVIQYMYKGKKKIYFECGCGVFDKIVRKVW